MLIAWGMIEEFFPLFVFVLFCFFWGGKGESHGLQGVWKGDQASPLRVRRGSIKFDCQLTANGGGGLVEYDRAF